MKKIVIYTLLILSGFQLFSIDEIKFFGAAIEGFPDRKSVYKLEYEFGFIPSVIQFYLQFDKNNPNLISNLENTLYTLKSFSIIPSLTLEPMYIENMDEITVPYEDILNGKYDLFLISLANEIKKVNLPVIIRFAQEMNLSRYHWGSNKNFYGPNSPDIYIKMYRYIYELFEMEKVKNALFAFCPNSDSVPNDKWNQISNYYPGDKYVDILGVDGYNWGGCDKSRGWRSFDQIFYKSIKELKQLSTKPIIIFESASSLIGGIREKWIEDTIEGIRKLDILGLIWFQVDKECSWKIKSKPKKKILKESFDISRKDLKNFFEELLNGKKGLD